MEWKGHDAGSEVLHDNGAWSGGAGGRPWWRSNQQGTDAGALGFVGYRRGQLRDHGGEAVARDAHDAVVEAGSMVVDALDVGVEWLGEARWWRCRVRRLGRRHGRRRGRRSSGHGARLGAATRRGSGGPRPATADWRGCAAGQGGARRERDGAAAATGGPREASAAVAFIARGLGLPGVPMILGVRAQAGTHGTNRGAEQARRG